MFEPEYSTKQRRIHIVVVVIAFFVAFALGIVIGHFAIKKPAESKEQDVDKQDKKAALQKRQEEMVTYHKKFQTTVSEQELESNLR